MGQRLKNGRLSPTPIKHNLPSQLKTFIGRENESAQLLELVRRERLVTLLGIGGVGKSSLAQTVAQHTLRDGVSDDFPDGIWFVPLVNVKTTSSDTAERIAIAIASAIHFPISNMQAPLAELTAFLSDKQMLLILDNWEHLAAAAEDVLLPLLHQTTVHMLATSRLRLGLDGERPFPLRGLPPAMATRLFISRARRLLPDFAPHGDAAIMAAIDDICHQVAGLPLGIELAASWVEHFSIAEIGQSLAKIKVEEQQAAELADRHHSLDAVLSYSWRLLAPHQQQTLAQLSVFRGGFDREAVTAVTHSNLSDLSTLISHSLMRRVAAGRYDLHPLVQEFATQKREPAQETALLNRYSTHYLHLLATVKREDQARRLFLDFENIRSAWQEAVLAANADLIQGTVIQFSEFMAQFGLMSDSHTLFQEAVAQFEQQPEQNELVARLLDQQWVFSRTLHGLKTASALQKRLLTLTNDVELLAKTHVELAGRYAEEGRWERADSHFNQAEALAKQSPDLHAYITVVDGHVHINAIAFRGDFAEGMGRLQEMLLLLDTINPQTAKTENLRCALHKSLSITAIRYGDYALAINVAKQNALWARRLPTLRNKVDAVLDLALAEQFAGMYAEAIAHNKEALAWAKTAGAADDVGLLQANLCLSMRQSGDLEEGLVYGKTAVNLLQTLGLQRMEGQARNRVGHTLAAMERWDEAYAAYGDALRVWGPLQHPNRAEAVAGRAAAAFALAKPDEATALVNEALSFAAAEGMKGVVEPVLFYLHLEHALSGLGRKDEAAQVLQQAQAWVDMIASRISEDEVRNIFLRRPDHLRLG